MADVTEERVASLSGLAENLSIQDDEVIQLYANSSIMNPDVQQVLESRDSVELLSDESNPGMANDAIDFTSEEDEDFGTLAFPEDDSVIGGLWSRIRGLFKGLRKKVRRIFCQVVAALHDTDLDIKKIIRDVLLALIPALAASAGLMPIALSIVVSLAAMLLKYGVSKVCPV